MKCVQRIWKVEFVFRKSEHFYSSMYGVRRAGANYLDLKINQAYNKSLRIDFVQCCGMQKCPNIYIIHGCHSV